MLISAFRFNTIWSTGDIQDSGIWSTDRTAVNKVFCCSREKGYQGIIDAPWVEGTTFRYGARQRLLLYNKHIEFSWTFTSSRSLKIEALSVSFCPFASAIIQLSTLTRLLGRRLMTPTEISEPRQVVWHWRTPPYISRNLKSMEKVKQKGMEI